MIQHTPSLIEVPLRTAGTMRKDIVDAVKKEIVSNNTILVVLQEITKLSLLADIKDFELTDENDVYIATNIQSFNDLWDKFRQCDIKPSKIIIDNVQLLQSKNNMSNYEQHLVILNQLQVLAITENITIIFGYPMPRAL